MSVYRPVGVKWLSGRGGGAFRCHAQTRRRRLALLNEGFSAGMSMPKCVATEAHAADMLIPADFSNCLNQRFWRRV